MPYHQRIAIAPMIDWTNRHCRYFHRQLTQHTTLYTEMITTGALIHGDADRFLRFDEAEQPLILQLGGSEPNDLARCTQMAADYGYSGVNLNVGCPSDRVQSGKFGACLMAEPELVARCLEAMQHASDLPVSVKTRLGIDNFDDYAFAHHFVETLDKVGCNTIILHARKAWLHGLSPKENREIPPLQYDRVYQLKQDFPHMTMMINGGITTYEAIDEHLQHVDGVMIGREAYQNPYFLAEFDRRYYGTETQATREAVIERMIPYIESQLALGLKLHVVTRHMLGLFNGLPGARHWRRTLSENACKDSAGIEIIKQALRPLE